jgi:hypothetical protein
MTFRNAGVESCRWISFAVSAEQYVKNVARDLADAMAKLVQHFAGEIDFSESGSDAEGLLKLLRDVEKVAVDECRRTGSLNLTRSAWYARLIASLNELLPGGSGVRIVFEGSIGEFLGQLMVRESRRFRSIDAVAEGDAAWFGRLAIISRLPWKGDASPRERRALQRLIDQFNIGNSC